MVPRSVLQKAKGFAIFTVVKAGFMFSARAGSGIVIARLEDGSALSDMLKTVFQLTRSSMVATQRYRDRRIWIRWTRGC